MKSGHASIGAGSLDMLLDTMCNTFGGVCFIALPIAILSAMLPRETTQQKDAEPDVQKLVEDERLAQLQRRRDELKNAAKLQLDLLGAATNATEAITVSEAELVSDGTSTTRKLLISSLDGTSACNKLFIRNRLPGRLRPSR